MKNGLNSTLAPDSMTGMIFAMEGIHNAIVLLNGPMGCRFYHSSMSEILTVRPALSILNEKGELVPVDYNYLNNWFFRQARVPCSYLDGYDYVYGTAQKVRDGLIYLKEHVNFEMISIINSPGASLIGDHLQDLIQEILPDIPCIFMETPDLSMSFEYGYDQAGRKLADYFKQKGRNKKSEHSSHGLSHHKSVNLIGLSIWNRYYEGDCRELRHLFELADININCMLFSGCNVTELSHLADADLNLVLSPEMGRDTANILHELYGQPYYICETLPIGFDATEKMMKDINCLLGNDLSSLDSFFEEAHQARALAYHKINAMEQMCGLPQGVSFHIYGNESQKKAFTLFLEDYLGMKKAPPEKAELVFGNANEIAALMLENKKFCGIEISYPGMGYVDLIPKTHLGIHGSLFLIEQVLNGLMSRL